MGNNYFITGATGFVGRYLVRELLEKEPDCCITLLVRASGGVSGRDKVDKVLRTILPAAQYEECQKRIRVLEGDVSQADFGLAGDGYQRLAEETNIIFHTAASIKFDLPLDEATRINVEGTRSVLKLAEKCRQNRVLERINHISTAYVTGKQKKSPNSAGDLEFANTYELTKYKAENLVGRYIDSGLPVTIYRPSIISGHSVTGEITSTSIIYLFILMLSRHMIPVFPCENDSSLNIIPIDYFIDSLMAISQLPQSIGMTYNITNPQNSNIRESFTFVCEELGVEIPQFEPQAGMNNFNPKVREQLAPFMNYFEQSHYFDNTETMRLLKSSFSGCGDLKNSLKRIIEYCYHNRLLRLNRRSSLADKGGLTIESLYV